ncbi:pilus assembly protein [Sphingomonas sp. FARSPH]|jgi:Flp pilus assembly protein TadG|nr:pilus assembly protein [Sphingomonas sp. FARSPH]
MRALARDRRGVSVIEFALIAAPMIALILAGLQTSLIYFAQQGLETAVEAAARSVVTGKAQASDAQATGMNQQQLAERFRQAACARVPRFLRCNRLYVEVASAPNWSGMSTTVPTLTFDSNGNISNTFRYDLGSQGSVVMVRLMYLWPIQTGPLGLSFSNLGAGRQGRLMVATSVAKTENF